MLLQDIPEEVAKIHKAMGRGVDVTFDCAGFNKTMSTALSATREGGKVCLIGLGHGEMTVPLTAAAVRYCYQKKVKWRTCSLLNNEKK